MAPSRPSNKPLLNTLALNTHKERDRRQSNDPERSDVMRERRIRDSSLGAPESGASPLDAGSPIRSYTDRIPANDNDESHVGGGIQPSAQWAIDIASAKQREMQRIQEQFTGGGIGPEQDAETRQGTEAETGEEAGGQEDGGTAEEEAYRASEAEQAQTLDAQRQEDARIRAAEERRIARDKAEKRAYELKQKFNNLVRYGSEASEGFSGLLDFGLSDLLLLLQMNVQMIMKYFFRPLIAGGNPQLAALLKGRPWFDQTNGEDFMTIWFDLLGAILIFLFISFCLAIMNGFLHPFDAVWNVVKQAVAS